ncbi:MAG: hypothetical protein ABI852_04995 [Gemmatimonadaceae bacterium]
MAPTQPFISWEALGRNAAPLLDSVNAVVIAGPDPVAAASFALGIARVHGSSRRVAIADLVGEVAPLQALITGDDGHGISDSFLYGVSLNKIARPLEGSGNVFLMPSGTESVANEAVYQNDRWRKLAAGFHQVGALLLVIAVPETPGFADLCAFVGAVFPMGDPAPIAPAGVPVISMPLPTPPEVVRIVEKAKAAGSEDPKSRNTKMIAGLFAMFAVAIILGVMSSKVAPYLPASIAKFLPGGAQKPATSAVSTDSVTGTNAAVGDSSRNGANAVPPTASGSYAIANPADSASASLFAVYLVAGSTREAATEPRIQTLPAVAISPVILEGDTVQWFRVTVGASEDQASSEALLTRLRTAKILGQASGTIVRVPFAFRLEEGLTVEAAPGAIADYDKRGISAYALKQTDGRVTLYTGAHETVKQAAYLGDSLRTQGVKAVLVYRTGRAF